MHMHNMQKVISFNPQLSFGGKTCQALQFQALQIDLV